MEDGKIRFASAAPVKGIRLKLEVGLGRLDAKELIAGNWGWGLRCHIELNAEVPHWACRNALEACRNVLDARSTKPEISEPEEMTRRSALGMETESPHSDGAFLHVWGGLGEHSPTPTCRHFCKKKSGSSGERPKNQNHNSKLNETLLRCRVLRNNWSRSTQLWC